MRACVAPLEHGGKGFGAGTVFKLSAQGTYSVVYRFGGSPDGLGPSGPVLIDKVGNLYGTTSYGGVFGEGAIFKITPGKAETVLHSFSATGGTKADGVFPDGRVAMDAQGNLYGTTYAGGAYHDGVAFRLISDGAETVLHSFGGSGDGGTPLEAGMLIDAQGNLYGTTFQGGTYGWGIVFKLSPDGTETILHAFSGGTDGANPSGLFMDSLGDLYGTTEGGGANNGGTIFEVTL